MPDVGGWGFQLTLRATEWYECACTLPTEHSPTLSKDERASGPSHAPLVTCSSSSSSEQKQCTAGHLLSCAAPLTQQHEHRAGDDPGGQARVAAFVSSNWVGPMAATRSSSIAGAQAMAT